MSTRKIPIRFIIGSREIFAVNRQLEYVGHTLDDLIGEQVHRLEELTTDSDGYRIQSAPPNAVKQYRHMAGSNFLLSAIRQHPRYFIDMKIGFDAYLGQFSSKTRSTLRRKKRKFEEHCGHDVYLRCYRTPEELANFFQLALPLSHLTYQDRLLNAGLPESDAAIEIAMKEAASDRIRAFLLFHHQQPVSYLYLPIANGILLYDFLGYHPEYARHSVGTVLQMEALDMLFTEGAFRFFDFTEGDGEHKTLFSTGSVSTCTFVLLRPSLTNRAILLAQRYFDSTIERASSAANWLGLRSKLRRLLRR